LLPDIAKNALAYTASIVSAPRIAADLGAERVFGVTPSAWIDEKVSAVGSGMATAAKYVVDHAGEVAKPVPVQPPEPKIPPSLPVGAYIEDHVAPQRTTEERLDLLERAMEVSPREPAPQPGPAGKTPAASPTLKVHSLEE
jgi:hypothetical protein